MGAATPATRFLSVGLGFLKSNLRQELFGFSLVKKVFLPWVNVLERLEDYHRTHFCGWHWKTPDLVHLRGEGRFAKHADGRVERPE